MPPVNNRAVCLNTREHARFVTTPQTRKSLISRSRSLGLLKTNACVVFRNAREVSSHTLVLQSPQKQPSVRSVRRLLNRAQKLLDYRVQGRVEVRRDIVDAARSRASELFLMNTCGLCRSALYPSVGRKPYAHRGSQVIHIRSDSRSPQTPTVSR